ncbi:MULTISPECIES: hypothetical protein [unclassified Mesorhizobium]|uniref:hypothetical protein n=1 Tax=unclassified Mesorhizobium TaxID=325217 RepID=UPI001FEE14A8|nr:MULTISPECIES: hypothetical protein [unclassified Mesorhizobium]
MTEQKPVRLPAPASVETVLAALEPQSADVDLAPALRGSAVETQQLAGPVYRVRGRSGGGIVHMRSFLSRRTRIERELARGAAAELAGVNAGDFDGWHNLQVWEAGFDWV